MSAATQVPVLIIGGGPVGLSTSILLSRLGVRSLLVERRAAPSRHPRGPAISTRTMEVLRGLGLEAEIRSASLATERGGVHYFFGSVLTAPDYRRLSGGLSTRRAALSPTSGVICTQDALEPILRAHAERLAPGQVRFGTELASLRQDAEGVTAQLADGASVRAAYAVAADGAASAVRESLGIALTGADDPTHNLSILFHADLEPWIHDRRSVIYFVEPAASRGYFLPVDRRRWMFNLIVSSPLRDVDIDGQWCARVVRAATGQAAIPVEILEWQPWTARSQVAERFIAGRVLLAGDAAHIVTPYSAAGMNLGIQDAHNLAWKLAGVLGGWADPALLTTYDAERRPVAEWTAQEDRRTVSAALGAGGSWEQRSRKLIGRRVNHGLVFGYHYDSPAVVPDGTPAPVVDDPYAHYIPTARPGHRAPHVWLGHHGRQVSVLDLLGPGFALLSGLSRCRWDLATQTARVRLGVPLAAHTIGQGELTDSAGEWAHAYDLDRDGAVLVRPDGHIAWRCASGSAQPERALIAALHAVLGRAPASAQAGRGKRERP